MTSIVSIHQPNNDLFQMFDKIYVLAKGGVCFYSGLPQNLRQHLTECDIECNENQVPIELLLKISSEDENNENYQRLKTKTYELNKCMIEYNLNENMKSISKMINISKRFKFKDFYILLKRTIYYNYRCQWKLHLISLIILAVIAFSMKLNYKTDIIEPNGCIEIEFGVGCEQTLQDIRNEYLIKLNIKYNMILMTSMSLIVMILMTITFSNEYNILQNEQQNCKHLFFTLFMIN